VASARCCAGEAAKITGIKVNGVVMRFGAQEVQHGNDWISSQGEQMVDHDQGTGVDERVSWQTAVVLQPEKLCATRMTRKPSRP
jgi:hypothetical protein